MKPRSCRDIRLTPAVLAAILALGVSSARAQAPPAGSEDHAGDFAVLQIATTDPNKLEADWRQPTPGVKLVVASTMKRHEPIFTFLVFKGCKVDGAGNCNLTARVEAIGPDGKVTAAPNDVPVWVNKPPAPNLNLQLSEAGFGLGLDDNDPLGAYRVKVAVTDNVAKVSLHTELTLTAVDK